MVAFVSAPAPATIQVPDGFTDELVASGLAEPVSLAFLPDGRLLVIERSNGVIKLQSGGAGSPLTTVGSVGSITTGGERGLLGIAVDPRWPLSPYLYIHATRPGS